MPSNFPGSNDSFAAPSSPSTTVLFSSGDSTRNHPQSHQDMGDAIVALETNVSLLSHDHSGTGSRATNKLIQANTHQSPDTDVSTTSLHHTIGTSATQAAAGNHIHSSTLQNSFAAGDGSRSRSYFAACYLTSGFPLSANSDTLAQSGWAALDDVDNLFVPNSGSNTYAYFNVPVSGRWRVFASISGKTTNSGVNTAAGKILRNGTNIVNNSICSNTTRIIPDSSEGFWIKIDEEIPLVSGDKIYSSLWSSVSCTIQPWVFNTGVVSKWGIRWVGVQ